MAGAPLRFCTFWLRFLAATWRRSIGSNDRTRLSLGATRGFRYGRGRRRCGPAGIKALRAFAKAPSHLVSAPISRHDPRARRPPLFSSHPPPTIRAAPVSSPPTGLSSHRSQTASSALREGLCELAYPEGASGAGALDEVLEASAETLDRLGGPKMTRATAGDVRELAVLHTACKVSRCATNRAPNSPRGPRADSTRRRPNAVCSTRRGSPLARRCECSHVDDSTRHQAIDETSPVPPETDWDAAKRLARLCVGSVAEGAAADAGADEVPTGVPTTRRSTPARLSSSRPRSPTRRGGGRHDRPGDPASRDADDVVLPRGRRVGG